MTSATIGHRQRSDGTQGRAGEPQSAELARNGAVQLVQQHVGDSTAMQILGLRELAERTCARNADTRNWRGSDTPSLRAKIGGRHLEISCTRGTPPEAAKSVAQPTHDKPGARAPEYRKTRVRDGVRDKYGKYSLGGVQNDGQGMSAQGKGGVIARGGKVQLTS